MDTDMPDSSTSIEAHKSSGNSGGAATAVAAAAAALSASSSSSRAAPASSSSGSGSSSSASSSAAARPAAASTQNMNLFETKPSKPSSTLALAEMVAPFSQAAAAVLAAAADRTSPAHRLFTTEQLFDAMEKEIERVEEMIAREERDHQKRMEQQERLQRDIPMLQLKLERAKLGEPARKAMLAARKARMDRLHYKQVGGKSIKLTAAEEAKIRYERTPEGCKLKVEEAGALVLNRLAVAYLDKANDFKSLDLLTSNPAHPDYARIRDELAADVAAITQSNVERTEDNKRYIEEKRAEEAKEATEIAGVKADGEDLEKEKKQLEETERLIEETDKLTEIEHGLTAEWNRQLDAANACAPPPEPSAQMAETLEWAQWIKLMDDSKQRRAPLKTDIKELEEQLARMLLELNTIRADRARSDKKYAKVFAEIQRLEQLNQRRAAEKAQVAGASDSAADTNTAPQSQQQNGIGSDDEKMSDEDGAPATRSQQPPQAQPQPPKRPMQAPAAQRNLPAGFIQAAPQPVFTGVNARPQHLPIQQHQPASALASQHFNVGQQRQPAKMPQPQARQQQQQLQRQQPQFGAGGGLPHHVYPMRTSSPQGPFRAQGSPWAANQVIRAQMPQPQMQTQMAQSQPHPQPQHYSQQLPVLPSVQRQYLPYDQQVVEQRLAAQRALLAQQEAAGNGQQPQSFMTNAQVLVFRQQQQLAQQQLTQQHLPHQQLAQQHQLQFR